MCSVRFFAIFPENSLVLQLASSRAPRSTGKSVYGGFKHKISKFRQTTRSATIPRLGSPYLPCEGWLMDLWTIDVRFFCFKLISSTNLSYPVKRKVGKPLVLKLSLMSGEMSRPFDDSFTKISKGTFNVHHVDPPRNVLKRC